MSSIELLKTFKTAYIDFIDELIEQFPDEADLVILRMLLANQVPVLEVINKFAQHALPHKELILKRDEQYFLEHEDIFQQIDPSTERTKVSKFKGLWMSDKMTEDTKETIWLWFKHFITLTERYLGSN